MAFPTAARLVSLQVGLPQHLGHAEATEKHDQQWYSGFYKLPVMGPIMARRTNLDGDGQADLSVHGGPDKAIMAYSADHYPFWHASLEQTLPYGAFGENLTIAGVTEEDLCIGDIIGLGAAQLQVSQPRQPCWKLARRWRLETLPKQVVAVGRTGWYFRVLVEGAIKPGESLRLLERPCPQFSIAHVNRLRYHDRSDRIAAEQLAGCAFLSATWRKHFASRL